jgi:hypothetical protein
LIRTEEKRREREETHRKKRKKLVWKSISIVPKNKKPVTLSEVETWKMIRTAGFDSAHPDEDSLNYAS